MSAPGVEQTRACGGAGLPGLTRLCETRNSRERAQELFSLSSSFNGGRQRYAFLIQRNRDKLFLRASSASEFSLSLDPKRTLGRSVWG